MPVPVHRLASSDDYLEILDGHPTAAAAGHGVRLQQRRVRRARGDRRARHRRALPRARRRARLRPAGMGSTRFLRSDELPRHRRHRLPARRRRCAPTCCTSPCAAAATAAPTRTVGRRARACGPRCSAARCSPSAGSTRCADRGTSRCRPARVRPGAVAVADRRGGAARVRRRRVVPDHARPRDGEHLDRDREHELGTRPDGGRDRGRRTCRGHAAMKGESPRLGAAHADQRRAALGATRRVPCQSREARHGARGLQAGGRRGVGDVGRLDVAVAPGLGREQPDDAVVGEDADGVDERVDEVAVLVAPPQHHDVDDVVVVLVDQLGAGDRHDGGPQVLVAVVVVPDLLHHARRQPCPSLATRLRWTSASSAVEVTTSSVRARRAGWTGDAPRGVGRSPPDPRVTTQASRARRAGRVASGCRDGTPTPSDVTRR